MLHVVLRWIAAAENAGQRRFRGLLGADREAKTLLACQPRRATQPCVPQAALSHQNTVTAAIPSPPVVSPSVRPSIHYCDVAEIIRYSIRKKTTVWPKLLGFKYSASGFALNALKLV